MQSHELKGHTINNIPCGEHVSSKQVKAFMLRSKKGRDGQNSRCHKSPALPLPLPSRIQRETAFALHVTTFMRMASPPPLLTCGSMRCTCMLKRQEHTWRSEGYRARSEDVVELSSALSWLQGSRWGPEDVNKRPEVCAGPADASSDKP